mmetsp:Transcript_146852/g.471504  ORF Transcript_146852/g.471504 Transcript_146852/m.471504 type:complete len:227 (+) Transcript_146852:269-949(+)
MPLASTSGTSAWPSRVAATSTWSTLGSSPSRGRVSPSIPSTQAVCARLGCAQVRAVRGGCHLPSLWQLRVFVGCVSYYFDCDPMVVKFFYKNISKSEAYIAGTTTATAQARGPGPPFRLNYRVVLRNPCFACLRFGAVTSTCVGFASVRVIPWVWGTYPVHGGANELYFVVSDIRKQFLVGNLGAFCDIASSPLSSMASQACVRSARLCATSWAGAHHRHRVRLSC